MDYRDYGPYFRLRTSRLDMILDILSTYILYILSIAVQYDEQHGTHIREVTGVELNRVSVKRSGWYAQEAFEAGWYHSE
jgi:hypothetical protein